MKQEMSRALSTVNLFLFLSLAHTATAQESILQSLVKRISPTSDALASESSLQQKHLAHHLAGRTLFKNVKIYNNFSDFLSLSNHIDEDMASKLANFVEFKVNGFPIAKPKSPEQLAYTWVPLQLNKPMKIQMTFNRWYASSLLSLIKSKVALPNWTSSRLVTLLDLVSLDISYERSLESTPDDEYFIADIICQNNTITKIINEPKSDSVYDLVKNYGSPGFFNLTINLPRVEIEQPS